MKTRVICLCLFLLAPLASGCNLFGGGKSYDGSEQAYERHPEWTDHTPGYMTGDDQDSENK